MTEHDKKLIAEAEALPPMEWECISNLKEECESEEAREQLHSIMVSKYHRDEYLHDAL